VLARDFDRGKRALSTYGEVMSVLGVFVHEKHGSNRSVLAPELSASDALSSPIVCMIVGTIEPLSIHPPLGELGVVDQSISAPYITECSLSTSIDFV